MKILFVKGDTGGCGYYRCDEPARVLRQLGHEVEVTTQLPVEGYANRAGMRLQKILPVADVIVVQRPLNKAISYAFELAASQGVRMLADLDDDLEKVDPANCAWRAVSPQTSPDSNWEWLRRSCDFAAGVIVSTPALQRYAPGRSTVVRNGVPEWVCDLPLDAPHDPLRIGWTGTVSTHPRDLHQVSGVIQQVLTRTGAEMHVIGEREGLRSALSLKDEPTLTPWLETVDEYLRALMHLDVGIVPLEISAFNSAKSSLKGLEMAAAGVPSVASPTPEYRLLAEDGGCFIADRPAKWIRQLTRLISDVDYRQETATSVREVIRARHTTEVRAEEWEKTILSYL